MGVKWGKVPEGDEQEYKGYQCWNLVRKENDNESHKGRGEGQMEAGPDGGREG